MKPLCKYMAIMLGVGAVISFLISIFEPTTSNTYQTGLLQAILCLMLWDRGE